MVDSTDGTNSKIFIRIFKEESVLELWHRQTNEEQYALRKSYPICAWSGTLGPKLKEGDKQSPEGFYRITRASLNPNSRFHLSFNIGFPNEFDRFHGRTGSFLMVHGDCVSIGCYAMTDRGIEEIYQAVEQAFDGGQSEVEIHIFPFRPTDERLRDERENEWLTFWENLADGYWAFEQTRRIPTVRHFDGDYIINQPVQSYAGD